MRDSAPIRLPGPGNFGWWAGVALLIAILLHVAAFFALGHVKISFGFIGREELSTRMIHLEPVAITPPDQELLPPAEIEQTPPDAAALLDEVDILDALPEDSEIDIAPSVSVPEFAIQLGNPAEEGSPEGAVIDPAGGFDFESALPELGRTPEPMPLAAEAQTVIDPGAAIADDTEFDRFAEDVLKKGAGGNVQGGTLDGVISLDEMLGLPADVLVGKATMLPSDLLFDYNSSELRESARVGLLKLAMIIEKNPGLFCWIEGHSDLFGSDSYNLDLSQRRAAAVKTYLTGTLYMPGEKIETRGFGRTRPILTQGTIDEQAPNRRVEIRMRRTSAPPQIVVTPKPEAPTVPPVSPAGPTPEESPEPVLVRPRHPLPVDPPSAVRPTPAPRPTIPTNPPPVTPPREVVPPVVPVEPPPPRATPVEEPAPRATPVEEPPPPRAAPVEEPPRRALPVEEPPPRAAPVPEDPAPLRAVPVE